MICDIVAIMALAIACISLGWNIGKDFSND